ncbi:uncharacterized protein F5147DRAFT_202066 [Suillus discolor]|uniref:Uncharacterized protein n=1 Tax=Suillus discolor TaxID=1912936 RepID=A0A9P7F5C6_9AGAM|nr:uncharacterized protein F5147DRAFT_202066 [Suillus discolor]KAG2107738.1 hypothetical protein F5147DRAFT_202066 [Suillus discolor]
MPGPCNSKKKKKAIAKKNKKKTSAIQATAPPEPPLVHEVEPPPSDIVCVAHEPPPKPPAPHVQEFHEEVLPIIHDPGNGPRVRDVRGFLTSFFAQPPSLEDPLCAEFSQEEVLQMLCTTLPEETAIVLWYNKSRATSRICPSCRRLYRLGDILPDLTDDGENRINETRSPLLAREQEISGLCSPVCFIVASFEYPSAIKTTWGRTADEIDDFTWDLLNGPGDGQGDKGLSLLLKMARLPDLGLGQLCLPDIDFDAEPEDQIHCKENYERDKFS